MSIKFLYFGQWAIILFAIFGVQTASAQQSACLQAYRNRVIDYNQDIKAAGYTVSLQKEKEKSAKADFLPKLSADGSFSYTGNPMELQVDIPEMDISRSWQGSDMKYGASLTLAQPLYQGGFIRAGYDKSKKEKELAEYEQQRITNNTVYNADVYYWNAVAQAEMVKIAEEFKSSVSLLVDVVRHRVQEEYTDRSDLLMAEVKLNDANFRLLQAENRREVARLSLNSFAGVAPDSVLQTDSAVISLREMDDRNETADLGLAHRPELRIALNKVEIQKAQAKMANAQFLPRVSVGIDGSYMSPGYNFRSDMDPNYVVYAKLSVPIFEWGKRKSTRRAGKYGIDIAQENHHRVVDNLRLEIETAYYTYSQSIEKVIFTESSLQKAAESEYLAMEKYKEGNISIVEVINAQLYHQEAKVNYIQSKLDAQIAKSGFERAMGRIGY